MRCVVSGSTSRDGFVVASACIFRVDLGLAPPLFVLVSGCALASLRRLACLGGCNLVLCTVSNAGLAYSLLGMVTGLVLLF